MCLRDSVFPSYFLRDKKKQNGDEPKKIAKKKLTSSPNNTTTNDNNNNGDRKWRKGFLKATPFFAVYNDAPKPNVKSILISSCFLLFLSLYPVCVWVCVVTQSNDLHQHQRQCLMETWWSLRQRPKFLIQ